MTQFTKLLYLKSVAGNEIITIGQYTTHQFHYPTSIMPTITYLLETYGLSLSYQTKQAKQILKIRKMVPIFITPQITLFPLKRGVRPCNTTLMQMRLLALNQIMIKQRFILKMLHISSLMHPTLLYIKNGKKVLHFLTF
ncbi:hypothetical protein SCO01_22780 [Staphylococcus cohnii subsp. cohnii]|nr:hypothetical protein SCO01_22780 [Staphylococcus cohnii subsp. cohnii]SUM07858.1 Uncharacterised protein [Staphylococcus cohnii]